MNRTYGIHKNLYTYLFLLTIFGPVNYGPPVILLLVVPLGSPCFRLWLFCSCAGWLGVLILLAGGGEQVVVRSVPHLVVGEPRSPLFPLEQVPPGLGRHAAVGGRRGMYHIFV